MARTRTTKKLAQRIDLNYFKRPTPLKRAKVLLSLFVPLAAISWIAWRGWQRDSRVYSSGRMSAAHAVLEQKCAACHVQKAGQFSSQATDSACLACHDGPAHQQNQIAAAVPTCATCHAEHRGRVQLRAASNQSCAECHASLKVVAGQTHYATRIHSFADDHPEFAAVRKGTENPGTIRLNHAIHMKPIRRGPNGPMLQLVCGDCHRPTAVNLPWPYEDHSYVVAKTSYLQNTGDSAPGDLLRGPRPPTGRERMSPVKFATACAGCHSLTFDKRFNEGVPHDKTEVVHAFLLAKFREYIATHPAELRVTREPKQELTGKPLPPEIRILTPAEWVSERTAEAEELLWRKTCKQCHAYAGEPPQTSLPQIAAARTVTSWFPRYRFDHDAHRGFPCITCHTKALTSTETKDILVPGITNCQTCHAPGPDHAESRCFECHTYHDWSKRKEIQPSFMVGTAF